MVRNLKLYTPVNVTYRWRNGLLRVEICPVQNGKISNKPILVDPRGTIGIITEELDAILQVLAVTTSSSASHW